MESQNDDAAEADETPLFTSRRSTRGKHIQTSVNCDVEPEEDFTVRRSNTHNQIENDGDFVIVDNLWDS